MGEQREKTFERKREVIDAAIEEFSQRGYENASLNNILKKAAISKGTFYYHFKNKEDLYFYIVELLIEEKKRVFKTRIKPEDYTKSIFDIFKLQMELGLELAKLNPQMNSFGQSFLNERGNDIYERAMKKYKINEDDYYGYIVDNAIEKGEFREDIPKDFIKKLIGFLLRNITEIADVTRIEDYEDPFIYLIDFMKDGLAKKY